LAPDYLKIIILQHPERKTLLSHLGTADYFISERSGVVDKAMIDAAPKLKLIQRLGTITEDIDTQAAKEAGINVCYWPIGSAHRVAEHMVMQMLVLSKKLHNTEKIALTANNRWGESRRTDEDSFVFNWSHFTGIDGLWHKTIGIIGFGEIGIELARRLQGWDCTLLYNSRFSLPEVIKKELELTFAESDSIFSNSDYICNLLPYSDETDQMINKNAFDSMKIGAYLVSCGSGSVIDEGSLADALKSGKIAGAALDTFEWEPLRDDNPLLALAKEGYNILLTPHVAAGDIDVAVRERVGYYTNIMNHINGRPLKFQVV
jgi:phosphoglycerate dehydrogenase-like enzyme